MVSPEIHFVGEREFGGGDTELIGLGDFLEDLVAARIFQFKDQLASVDRFMT